MLASDVTPAQVCVALTDVRDRIAAASNQTLPSVAAIATSLSAAQRQHIARKFEKNNAAWQEEWNDPDPEARREKRLKAAVENAEQLYDSLTEKQIALLRELDASSSYDTALAYKERLRRQKDWLQTFARLNPPNPADKPDLALANIIVQETFARNSQSPDPNYRAFAEKMYAESCNAFAVIHNSTTPKQRERAIKRIAAYARDARELMTVKPTK
jgi:hypothetical protein